MFSLTVKGKLDELSRALGVDAPKKLKRETATAINATARKTVNLLAKEIGKELATPQKEIKRKITVSDKAKPQKLAATVKQRPTSRLSLKRFSARQTSKGVSYKISKSDGRKTILGAFIPPRLGNHVYRRRTDARLPIDKLEGPSPWGVTVKKRLDKLIAKRDVKPELIKQINRRIRAVNFKKSQGR
jgi:hypothetical protein